MGRFGADWLSERREERSGVALLVTLPLFKESSQLSFVEFILAPLSEFFESDGQIFLVVVRWRFSVGIGLRRLDSGVGCRRFGLTSVVDARGVVYGPATRTVGNRVNRRLG